MSSESLPTFSDRWLSEMDTTRFEQWLLKAGLEKKQHQIDGVKFCLKNEIDHFCPFALTSVLERPFGSFGGGLVADEMGLGKTYVMLGTIISNFLKRTLIVLPLALVTQWENIIFSTCGHKPLVWHGENKKNISYETLANSPIVLTTYGHISSGKNDSENPIYKIQWNRVIFDEAHHLRNAGTSRFIGAKKINADIRWLITGTPIQNRFSDFFALCSQMGIKKDFYSDPKNIGFIAKNYMLKRTKEEVGICLPPVNTHNIYPEWKNHEEKEISEQVHSLLAFANLRKNVSASVNSLGGNSGSILPYLIRARQTCIYPALLKKPLQKLMEDGFLEMDQALLEGTNFNSKIDSVVDNCVKRKNNGRGKLIFCHFRGEIDILKDKLSSAGLRVDTFDGRTPKSIRKEILENKSDVLILQYQTGCEGLNLQQYKEIHFVSPNWNPAVEDQAIARSHRIGQDSEVDVFRYEMDGFGISTKNIEKYSRGLQDEKRDIAKDLDKVSPETHHPNPDNDDDETFVENDTQTTIDGATRAVLGI